MLLIEKRQYCVGTFICYEIGNDTLRRGARILDVLEEDGRAKVRSTFNELVKLVNVLRSWMARNCVRKVIDQVSDVEDQASEQRKEEVERAPTKTEIRL
ncbi:hypothetical protein E2C01_067842 [Portunus trituberculatus]|uniref:Uncharacterized protein n=1 Tax=Portunus trituberculatus TaxID=210409 RepID=A0A5B7HM51_PORTR|nr:hypothetical protein [Portunus trituberculatus]